MGPILRLGCFRVVSIPRLGCYSVPILRMGCYSVPISSFGGSIVDTTVKFNFFSITTTVLALAIPIQNV